MVDVKHRPIKEFIVYRRTKSSSPSALARRVVIEASPVSPPHLRWIKGIVYRLTYPAVSVISDAFVKEFLEGRVWVEVDFAEMSEFRSTVNSQQENVIVPILDSSEDASEAALVEWLKSTG